MDYRRWPTRPKLFGGYAWLVCLCTTFALLAKEKESCAQAAHWSEIDVPVTSNTALQGVHFPTSTVGYAVGSFGTVIKTADGGHTWVAMTAPTGAALLDVFFHDTMSGYVVGLGGAVYFTADGGSTWTPVSLGTSNDLYAVHFHSTAVGMVVGDQGSMYRTEDGGVSWSDQSGVIGLDLVSDVWLPQPGAAVALRLTRVYTTADSGVSWSRNFDFNVNALYLGVTFADASNGLVVGDPLGGALIFRTTDGGVTWTREGPPTWTQSLMSVSSYSSTDAIAVGTDGAVLRTTNGGSTWVDESFPTNSSSDLTDISMVNSDEAIAVGWNGLVIRRSSSVVGTAETRGSTEHSKLLYTYPDPFHSATTISYQLGGRAGTRLDVFDILGRRVAELASGTEYAGTHEVTFDATGLPSGVYFCRLQAGDYVETKWMVVAR